MKTFSDWSRSILDLYRERGAMEYEGEGVTQIAHAAQCGALARAAGAHPELELAAWLHDIGHLLAGLPGTPTLEGIDDHHEKRGAAFLHEAFGPEVAEPVRLHVAAKRYLVAIDPGYYEGLSTDSRRSLRLQGGPMSLMEQETFRKHPYARDALRVRTWDEAAKLPQRDPDALVQLERVLLCARARVD
jgi:phosphonate degradation associated HDIG domain protein